MHTVGCQTKSGKANKGGTLFHPAITDTLMEDQFGKVLFPLCVLCNIDDVDKPEHTLKSEVQPGELTSWLLSESLYSIQSIKVLKILPS